MKVLIITEGYFPGNNYGGPPVSINNLCRLLKDKADFFIITKDHDFKNRKRYDNITDGWNKSPEASILYCNDSKYNYNTFVDSDPVSRIVWKKNLLFALQVINRVNDGSLQFDIYGSIEEPQYWEECLKIINNFNNKIKINYCGVCKHDDIPIILSSYDALFFPTFSENYGHIIAESLSVGLPIIISDQTPWSNINSTKGGWAIPLKDEDMYLKAVESIIGCSSTEMKYRVEDSIAFFRKFTNIDLLRDDYLKSFSSLK